ncbi:MAG: hypothetical protein EXS37_06485 [Opitutus sp.]|nr:hypothetical protein [Opitutus sp.]
MKTCALFVPLISAATQARLEGYFRLEWKLAAQRTHTMADAKPFLLPVVIDATGEAEAHVPEEFRAVQWTQLSGGETPAAFCARVKKLLSGTELEVGWSRPTQRDDGVVSPTKPKPLSFATAIIALAILAAGGWWFAPHRPVTDEAARRSAPPISEASKLLAQARALIDDDLMSVRENYRLAEELCLRAVNLAPGDGEAWATLAQQIFVRAWTGDIDGALADLARLLREPTRGFNDFVGPANVHLIRQDLRYFPLRGDPASRRCSTIRRTTRRCFDDGRALR